MIRRVCLLQGLLLLLVFRALALERMETRIYPLGVADFEAAERMARGVVSTEGKLLAQKEQNRLILHDYPARHEALCRVLANMGPVTQHARIEVSFEEGSVARSKSPESSGRLGVGSVTMRRSGAPSDNAATVRAKETRASLVGLVQQELLIISGGRGQLRIAKVASDAGWFWEHGLRNGWWAGKVGWREVEALMVVEPYVLGGGQIRLRFSPGFSYLANGERSTTVIDKLTTEIVIGDGEETVIGADSASDREFYSRFLTAYDEQGDKHPFRIIFKPSVVSADGAAR